MFVAFSRDHLLRQGKRHCSIARSSLTMPFIYPSLLLLFELVRSFAAQIGQSELKEGSDSDDAAAEVDDGAKKQSVDIAKHSFPDAYRDAKLAALQSNVASQNLVWFPSNFIHVCVPLRHNLEERFSNCSSAFTFTQCFDMLVSSLAPTFAFAI